MATADALNERLMEQLTGAMEVVSVHLGVTLGLYDDLARSGPADAATLAHRVGIAPRYAREWLEQQAAAGFLDVIADGEPDARVFDLSDEHRAVLVDREDPHYAAAVGSALVGIGRAVPMLTRAFRSGRGVPYAEYGQEMRDGIAGANLPMYVNELAQVWMPALGDAYVRLQRAAQPRILDLGCGTGNSTVALAQAFPNARVDGVDLDDASVATARSRAKEAHVDDRVVIRRADAATLEAEGYDLVCLFEVVHDAGDPEGVLRAARRALAPDGVVLVADEKVAETFTAPGDLTERLNYGYSVLHCLPATMAEDPVRALGTVMRPDVFDDLARSAGFTDIEVLDIDNDAWRFWALAG